MILNLFLQPQTRNLQDATKLLLYKLKLHEHTKAKRNQNYPKKYINALHADTLTLTKIPNNFHKMHLNLNEGVTHTLGEKFLGPILQMIKSHGDYQANSEIIIPFGGPGSMAVYFSQKNMRTISGDINYKTGTLYGTSEERLIKTQQNPHAKPELIEFRYWDAKELPFQDQSKDLMIINPPYGIECKLLDEQEKPIELLLHSLEEANRVLKNHGVIYLVWPTKFMDEDLSQISQTFNVQEKVVQGNNIDISLIRLTKK